MAKELISNIYLFKNLTSSEMEQISSLAKLDKLAAGETIFEQGAAAKAIYVVRYGSVKIMRTTPDGEQTQVAVLGTGSHFGEMGFVDGAKRSGTASAAENSEIVRIDYTGLKTLLDKSPTIAASFYRALAGFLAARLDETNRDLSFARKKAA